MFYKRIKELRKEKGITQVNVSTNIGVEESYYGKYERGVHDIPLSVLIKLADFYNVSLDYITERTNKREINK
ncbi:MAG: helix-turn-helix transcriptional regulator [Eubacterium sp.]|nr:helix-turn-helix transcriptional regulator [Eubacterium sp.]